jgi:hypothetical protein
MWVALKLDSPSVSCLWNVPTACPLSPCAEAAWNTHQWQKDASTILLDFLSCRAASQHKLPFFITHQVPGVLWWQQKITKTIIFLWCMFSRRNANPGYYPVWLFFLKFCLLLSVMLAVVFLFSGLVSVIKRISLLEPLWFYYIFCYAINNTLSYLPQFLMFFHIFSHPYVYKEQYHHVKNCNGRKENCQRVN